MSWQDTPDLDPSDVRDVFMPMTSLGLVVVCAACGQQHEAVVPTIGGLGFGVLTCPGCEASVKVTPEVLEGLLETWVVDLDFDEACAVNRDVQNLVETWHRTEPWREILTYKGTNLGEPTERELACWVNSVFCSRSPEEIGHG